MRCCMKAYAYVKVICMCKSEWQRKDGTRLFTSCWLIHCHLSMALRKKTKKLQITNSCHSYNSLLPLPLSHTHASDTHTHTLSHTHTQPHAAVRWHTHAPPPPSFLYTWCCILSQSQPLVPLFVCFQLDYFLQYGFDRFLPRLILCVQEYTSVCVCMCM